MLTPKQHELLMFIHERIRETGVSPSFDEMKDALDLRSKSGIHRLITALEERGFIRRLAHKARALEVLRLPDAVHGGAPAGGARAPRGGFTPSIVRGGGTRGRASAPPPPALDNGVEVPVRGRIAAGVPKEAIESDSYSIGVPMSMLRSRPESHYALEVQGDSMIDAGILDGDTVIIQYADTAQNGEIVVALIDDEEATLKRLHARGNRVALEAANPAYETRIYGPDRVQVQGRLVGLLRRYQ